MDEATNAVIRDHEIQTDEWEYSKLSEHLYTWFDRFNERFFHDKLQTPAVSFRITRINTLGHYVINRNEFGLKWNININRLYTDRPLVEILGTYLHEMIHMWQQEFGKKRNRSNYHNVEYRKKSMELGIPSNERGMTLGCRDPFVAFLREHGVDAEITIGDDVPLPISIPGKSKLKRWSCGCTYVWVGVKDFQAKCLNEKCGNIFELGKEKIQQGEKRRRKAFCRA